MTFVFIIIALKITLCAISLTLENVTGEKDHDKQHVQTQVILLCPQGPKIKASDF
jgi:hypothetical protein